MLDLILNDLHSGLVLWNTQEVCFVLRGAVHEGWHEGVETLLKSRCTQILYLSMSYPQRLDFISLKVGEHLETPDEYLRDRILLSIMAEPPFAGVALQFLI